MIGIIGAMSIEVGHLKNQMTDLRVETLSGIDFHIGKLKEKEVVVATSGVGKVHAAICAQTMILRYQPSFILNTGVAGGLRGKTKIGDLVIASAVVQHDMDTSAVGDPVGMISGINRIEIPTGIEIVQKLKAAAENLDPVDPAFGKVNIHEGVIATGDQFFKSQEQFNQIHHRFQAIAAEMEGASIGQVCYVNGISFGVVRAISDCGDENSGIDYATFIQPAAKRSFELLLRFIEAT